MRRIAAFLAVLVSILATLLPITSPAFAQEENPLVHDPTVEAQPPLIGDEETPLIPPSGIVTELPYARWTRHVGKKAEESIALVQVDQNGTTRTTTALVMRCDGFLLVPVWVFEAMKAGARLSVCVTEAEGESVTAPLPISTRNHHGRPSRYGVVKVTGHHLPSLPMLAASNIQPGTPIRILTAQPGKSPGQCEAVSVPAVIGSLSEKKDQWTLVARPDQPLSLAESAPVGAVVVDEESGAALGMVMQSGDSPVFSSFLLLHDICQDVGLVSNRAILAERKKMPQHLGPEQLGKLKPTGTADGYVWVPGGPVRLWGAQADSYQRAYGTDIACTPGFFVSANLVTNGEYREWLLRQPVPRRPFGWDRPDELKSPLRIPLVPVVGMNQTDAMVYAAAHNGRLLTEVEWSRAAISKDTTWARELMTNWYRCIRAMWTLWAHRFAILDSQLLVKKASGSNKSNNANNNEAVRAAVAAAEIEARLGTVRDNTTAFLLEIQNLYRLVGEVFPPQLGPVGYRKLDTSIFGVRDVLLNAPEMVQGLTQATLPNRAPKMLPAPSDPTLSYIQYARLNENTGNPEKYLLSISDVQKLLRTTNIEPEDRIYLTFTSIMASMGESRRPSSNRSKLPVPSANQNEYEWKN